MRKSYRVKRERDFNDIFSKGHNVANRRFVVYRLANQKEHFRVGLSVSKKLGNAVTRNKIKRRLRHVLLELKKDIQAEDFVIIARKGVEELTYQEIKKNLLHVLKLAKLYQEGVEIEKEN
ncbi:TPA: ribonuclease P protein component [Streptococcus suis]|uniref:ribonuclease P protein component n=1 Tax=Streptococcus suis TaxID=1307 RepID=UPI0015567BCF|nr:ribonuclease P protein component [Streptococcus suis]NQO46305.1 ribonuclease P protein component [Streptococcus suis]UUM57030.1 ribonuclease P protein component [Streptococcus suis]WNF83363.1 ribonuclease P protein component [Streptococcus suis]